MPKKSQNVYVRGDDGKLYQYQDEFDEEPVRRRTTKAAKTTKRVTKASKATKATKVAGKRVAKALVAPARRTKTAPVSTKAIKKTAKATKAAKVAKAVVAVAKASKRALKAKETSEEDVEVDEEELRELNQKERVKLYKKYKRYCNQFEKEQAKAKYDKLEEWRKIDLLLTSAASILSRYRGLKSSKKTAAKSKHLPGAVDPLRAKGETQFKLALEKAANLSDEDSAKLWKAQERNVGVTNYDDLITKKTYNSRRLGLPDPVQTEAEGEADAEIVMQGEACDTETADVEVPATELVAEEIAEGEVSEQAVEAEQPMEVETSEPVVEAEVAPEQSAE